MNTVYNGCGILTGQMRIAAEDKGRGFPDTYMACDVYYLDTVKDWFQEAVNVSDTDIVIAVQKGNPKAIQSLHRPHETGDAGGDRAARSVHDRRPDAPTARTRGDVRAVAEGKRSDADCDVRAAGPRRHGESRPMRRWPIARTHWPSVTKWTW